jgi:hypothetical protein
MQVDAAGAMQADAAGAMQADAAGAMQADAAGAMQADAAGAMQADAAGAMQVDAGPAPGVVPEPEDEAAYVFNQKTLRTYNIVVDPAELAKIEADPSAEEYVTGTLELDGKTYGPLGVRYKGSVGAFLPPCTGDSSFRTSGSRGPRTGKCSMKLDFDRIDPEGRFYGLKKLNFHSGNRDPALLRDRLGYAMFREFGIAAPRSMHARLMVNGEFRGVYIVVEQIDGRFTKARFSEGGDGNVYKEVWPRNTMEAPYRNALATNKKMASVEKFVSFAGAMAKNEDASEWLDMEYMFRYIAVDRVIVNDDGPMHSYCSYNHNFYWYEAEHRQRFWLIPWDLDASFQLGKQAMTHLTPAWNAPTMSCTCGFTACDPVWKQFANRKDEYEHTVDDFIAGPYSEKNVNAKLQAWTVQIDAAMKEANGLGDTLTYEQWQEAVATFKTDIETTRQHRGYPYDAE